MTALTMTRVSDSNCFLQKENRRRDVFVAQLGEYRKEEQEEASHVPTVCEASSELKLHHRKASQTVRLIKTAAENERMTAELAAKKQEFKEKLEVLARRRGELLHKEECNTAHALEFDRYLQDCEVKKKRALEKYKRERINNSQKRQEIRALRKELKKLRLRQEELQKKMSRYKPIEDFLNKVLDVLPSNYLGSWDNSMVRMLIKRHEALMSAKHALLKNLSIQQHNLEKKQNEWKDLQEDHETKKYMLITKVSELQAKYNELHAKNMDLMQYITYNEGLFTDQNRELGSMLLAISGMAELSYMKHYGPLEEMTLQSKLDMIQEFILRKIQIKEETSRFIELHKSSSCFFKAQPQKLKSGSKLSFYL